MSQETFQAFLKENFDLPQEVIDKLWNGNIHSIEDLASVSTSMILRLVDHPVLINAIIPVLQKYSREIASAEDPYKIALDFLHRHAEDVEGPSSIDTPPEGDAMPFVDGDPSTSHGNCEDNLHSPNPKNVTISDTTMTLSNIGGNATYNIKKLIISGNALKYVSRNSKLYDLLEKLAKVQIAEPTDEKKEILTSSGIKKLQDLAATHQKQNKFQKAVETLQIFIDHVEGWDKLQPSIDQAECLLSLKKIPEAEVVCVSIVSIVDANQSPRLNEESRDVYGEKVDSLITKFLNAKACDCSFVLLRCRFQFVVKHYFGKRRLNELMNIGWLMGNISEEMKNQEIQEQFNEQYSFMKEVCDFMQHTNDTDLNIKCESSAWVFLRFGFSCNNLGDWSNSITLNECAIALMKTVFHVSAGMFNVYGRCHNNMGYALEMTNHFSEAKAAYYKACEIYSTACDWSNDRDKFENIAIAWNNFVNMEKKIEGC